MLESLGLQENICTKRWGFCVNTGSSKIIQLRINVSFLLHMVAAVVINFVVIKFHYFNVKRELPILIFTSGNILRHRRKRQNEKGVQCTSF